MENLHVKLEGVNNNEIIWREGDAPPIVKPVKLNISGDIRSVGLYASKRRTGEDFQRIDPDKTIVEANMEAGAIWLRNDPNNEFGSSVTGTLLESDELRPFFINGSKKFSQKDLVKLLKFSRNYFPHQEQYSDLLLQYMKVQFKTSTSGQSAEDDRGNKSKEFNKTVETNLPTFFTLKMPIYKGEDSKLFRVEICLEVTDAGATFWLESVELHEIQQIEKELIFKRELEYCEGLIVIHK